MLRRKISLESKKSLVEEYEEGKSFKNHLIELMKEGDDNEIKAGLLKFQEIVKGRNNDLVSIAWNEEMQSYILEYRMRVSISKDEIKNFGLNLFEKLFSTSEKLRRIEGKKYKVIADDLLFAFDMDMIGIFENWNSKKKEKEDELIKKRNEYENDVVLREVVTLRETKRELELIAKSKVKFEPRKTFPRTWNTLQAMFDVMGEKLNE